MGRDVWSYAYAVIALGFLVSALGSAVVALQWLMQNRVGAGLFSLLFVPLFLLAARYCWTRR